MTLNDMADAHVRHGMLTAARSWKNPASPRPGGGCRRIGAPDWLSCRENPLLRHHRTAVARDVITALVDRVLAEVEDDEDPDDERKVESMRNYDRVDGYIAALRDCHQ